MSRAMYKDQCRTSPRLVADLLASQYPPLAGVRVEPGPMHGTDSYVYRVGDRYCVRLPVVEWAFGQEERIRAWLPTVAAAVSLEVPTAVFHGRPEFGYPAPWTVHPWVEGASLTPGEGVEDEQLANDVAHFLRQLQRLPTSDAAPSGGLSPHDLTADLQVPFERVGQRCEGDLAASWRTLLLAPAWDGRGATWLHGDVAPGNLIVRDGRLVAAIDWGGLGVGDPANDLQVAWNLFTPRTRAVFREAVAADDAVWARARARAFAQACFQLSNYRDTLQPLADQALRTLNEVLAELDS